MPKTEGRKQGKYPISIRQFKGNGVMLDLWLHIWVKIWMQVKGIKEG